MSDSGLTLPDPQTVLSELMLDQISVDTPYWRRSSVVVIPQSAIDDLRRVAIEERPDDPILVNRIKERVAEIAKDRPWMPALLAGAAPPLAVAATPAMAALAPGALITGMMAVSLGSPSVYAGIAAWRNRDRIIGAVRDLLDSGTAIRQVGDKEAEDLGIDFGPGGPQPDTVYVGHPLDFGRYYPFAEFHARLFEDKFIDATRLLMALGAERIETSTADGVTRSVTGSAGVEIPVGEAVGLPDGSVGSTVEAGRGKTSSRTALCSATVKGDGDTPHVPKGLLWLPFEPGWKMLTEARLNHGATELELQLSYANDFGVNTKLEGKFASAKLLLGGKLERQATEHWTLKAVFPPLRSK